MENKSDLLNISVKGKTKIYGLIGNPVGHTISPQIHNTLAKALDIDMVYIPIEVKEDKLEDAIKGIKALGFHGFNVTIPYKEKVIQYLDVVDSSAKTYDAVNTVLIKDGKLIGFNTDADGFYRAFVEAFKCEVEGLKVLIVGAGGSASSIAYILALKGASSITIANRTIDNAIKICERIGITYKKELSTAVLKDDLDIASYDVIVNTTSVGMYPNVNNTILKESIFNSKQKIVDIIYNPSETNFLKRAREKGAATLNGFGMLYYQGVIAFEIWNSMKLPENIEKNIYEIFRSNLGKIIK